MSSNNSKEKNSMEDTNNSNSGNNNNNSNNNSAKRIKLEVTSEAEAPDDALKGKIKRFCIWARVEGANFPLLTLSPLSGYGLGFTSSERITPGCTLVSVPCEMVIDSHRALESWEIGEILRQLLQETGVDEHLVVCLFLIHERAKGTLSYWDPYIAMLPEGVVESSALAFGDDKLKRLLGGSYVEQKVREIRKGLRDKHEVVQKFCVERHPKHFPPRTFSLEALSWAYSMFWSRAIVVPQSSKSGVNMAAMVPIVDILNHSPYKRTRFEVAQGPGSSRLGLNGRGGRSEGGSSGSMNDLRRKLRSQSQPRERTAVATGGNSNHGEVSDASGNTSMPHSTSPGPGPKKLCVSKKKAKRFLTLIAESNYNSNKSYEGTGLPEDGNSSCEQIFINYGGKGTDELLMHYGFVLGSDIADRVCLELSLSSVLRAHSGLFASSGVKYGTGRIWDVMRKELSKCAPGLDISEASTADDPFYFKLYHDRFGRSQLCEILYFCRFASFTEKEVKQYLEGQVCEEKDISDVYRVEKLKQIFEDEFLPGLDETQLTDLPMSIMAFSFLGNPIGIDNEQKAILLLQSIFEREQKRVKYITPLSNLKEWLESNSGANADAGEVRDVKNALFYLEGQVKVLESLICCVERLKGCLKERTSPAHRMPLVTRDML
eukprot:Nk52_evm3s156 gene=Nk52_evmTU3s156